VPQFAQLRARSASHCVQKRAPGGYCSPSTGQNGTPRGASIAPSGARGRRRVGCTTDCSCTYLPVVELVGPVGKVVSVTLDGEVLPSTSYRVDNGNQLVRTDGGTWPACQDMSAGPGAPFTFAVTYVQGFAPDNVAAWAAGLLAVEFAKACRGEKCALPRGVQTISRQGVGLTINQDMFAGGSTGITVVDAYVRLLNPNHLTQPVRIYSPDRRAPRQTTWQHG